MRQIKDGTVFHSHFLGAFLNTRSFLQFKQVLFKHVIICLACLLFNKGINILFADFRVGNKWPEHFRIILLVLI